MPPNNSCHPVNTHAPLSNLNCLVTTVLHDQHSEPSNATHAPHPSNVRSNPRHTVTPTTPITSVTILIIVNRSFSMKCARTANHNGLVNSKTPDIEEDTPNDIAIFNNPIVPADCNDKYKAFITIMSN